MPRFRTFIPLAALMAGTLAAMPGTASAQPVAFGYSTSELGNSASVDALYERIQRRSRAACGRMSRLIRLSDRNDCRAAVTGAIVERIGNARLDSRHEQWDRVAIAPGD